MPSTVITILMGNTFLKLEILHYQWQYHLGLQFHMHMQLWGQQKHKITFLVFTLTCSQKKSWATNFLSMIINFQVFVLKLSWLMVSKKLILTPVLFWKIIQNSTWNFLLVHTFLFQAMTTMYPVLHLCLVETSLFRVLEIKQSRCGK